MKPANCGRNSGFPSGQIHHPNNALPVQYGVAIQQPGANMANANWLHSAASGMWPQQPQQQQPQQVPTVRVEEPKGRGRYFLQQQERLRSMGTTRKEPLSADALIQTMMNKESDFLPKHRPNVAPDKEHHTMPMWLSDVSLIPPSYQKVYNYVQDISTGMVDTGKLTQLLSHSQLSREVLGFLWSLANQQVPGQLMRHELYVLLALVAAVQAGYTFNDLSILSNLPQPIVPTFAQTPIVEETKPAAEEDDDFSDFQSATPQFTSVPHSTVTSGAETKQPEKVEIKPAEYHDVVFSPVLQPKFNRDSTSVVGSRLANYNLSRPVAEDTATEDRYSAMEDKYAALRSVNEPCEDLMEVSNDLRSVFRTAPTELNSTVEPVSAPTLFDDDFSDFASAPVTDIPVQQTSFRLPIAPVTILEPVKTVVIDKDTPGERDEFGDFFDASSNKVDDLSTYLSPAVQKSNDVGDLLDSTSTKDEEFGDFLDAKKLSPENQSVCSLEFASVDPSNLSRRGSTPSLDLKVEEEDKVPTLIDKYSAVRDEIIPDQDRHTYEWGRCLQSCLDLVQFAVTTFNSASSSHVAKEVLTTDEGSSYFQNIVEVYRVACRIRQSYEKSGGDPKLKSAFTAIAAGFESLKPFAVGTNILPDDAVFDFSLCLENDNLVKACGVCLLNTETPSKAYNHSQDSYKLSYGGRQYHAACANLWVNCVDSILPALPFNHLL